VDGYDLLLVAGGLALLLITLGQGLLERLNLNSSYLYLAVGLLAGPLEEESSDDEAEDRFGLSSEAGLNDGFAFPFVYLGLYLTLRPDEWREWIVPWIARDLLYAVLVALPAGWYLGRLCGRYFVSRAGGEEVSRKRRLFVPLALLLFTYGLVEVLGGYGFLAAFTGGLGLRHAFHRGEESETLDRFASFSESLDELVKAAVLVMVGALVPWSTFGRIGWPLLGFALLLILVIRPAITLLATAGGGFGWFERLYWGWFGIRGIGSIYYLSYALGEGLERAEAETLFAITLAAVLVSVLVHGPSVRPVLERFEGKRAVEE
jgi:sodium/hydrogen antiporter